VSKIVHVGALLLMAFAVILLMTPAAVHRIAYEGEDTERFHIVGSRLVVAAAVPLGLSIGADLFVAITKATESAFAGTLGALMVMAVLAALWFVHPLIIRSRCTA
jgi:hypothetical protein